MAASKPSAGQGILGMLGVASELPLEEVVARHGALLKPGEQFIAGFQHGRDTELITTHRVISSDTKGLLGKKTVISSFPYPSVSSFAVTSCGTLDSDAELELWGGSGSGHMKIDMAKQVDLKHLQKMITYYVSRVYAPESHGVDLDLQGKLVGDKQSKHAGQHFIGKFRGIASPLAPEQVQRDHADLLLPGENVIVGMQHGRDTEIFTDTRFISVDTKGLTGKKVETKIIPYHRVSSWEICSAGTLDSDSELDIMTHGMSGWHRIKVKKSVNVYDMQKMLANHVLNAARLSQQPWVTCSQLAEAAAVGANAQCSADDTGKGFLGIVGGVACPIPLEKLNADYADILLPGEKFLTGYAHGRDAELFTNLRFCSVDVKGLTGKSAAITSVPYDTISCWSVQSAGSFLDSDTDVVIVCKGASPNRHISLSRKINVAEFQKILAAFCCDANAVAQAAAAVGPTGPALAQQEGVPGTGPQTKGQGFMGFVLSVASTLPMEQLYRDHSWLLLPGEQFLAGYQHGRDTEIFTTLRVISIDVSGLISKKTEVTSLPYSRIACWNLSTKGTFLDVDSDLDIFLDGNAFPHHISFSPHTNIFEVQKYLSIGCCAQQAASAIHHDDHGAVAADGGRGLLGMLGVASSVDPREVWEQFGGLMLPNEVIVAGYRHGRDLEFFTTNRVVKVDTQGFIGKKLCITSIPYNKIKSWHISSAGFLDMDADLCIGVSGKSVWYDKDGNPHLCDLPSFDISLNRESNIFNVQRLLAHYCSPQHQF